MLGNYGYRHSEYVTLLAFRTTTMITNDYANALECYVYTNVARLFGIYEQGLPRENSMFLW
jgi:methylaspartate ammonia-lyase